MPTQQSKAAQSAAWLLCSDLSSREMLAKAFATQKQKQKQQRTPAADDNPEPPAQRPKTMSLEEKAEERAKNDAEVAALGAKAIRANPHVLDKLPLGTPGWIKKGVVARSKKLSGGTFDYYVVPDDRPCGRTSDKRASEYEQGCVAMGA